MNQEENILALFDQYFQAVDKNQIQKDVSFVNSLGKGGVSFEEYLKNLDSIAAIPLAETGICDDITYSGLYNDLISSVSMDDSNKFQTMESIRIEFSHSGYSASESIYPMAA